MKKKKTVSSSAFFNPRILFGLALGVFGLALSLFAAGVLPGTAATQAGGPAAKGGPKGSLPKNRVAWSQSVKNDVSPALRDQPMVLTLEPRNCEVKENPPTKVPHTDAPDGALQQLEAPKLALAQPNIPATTLNFEGIDFPGVVCSCNPPDTDGAVGLNQYVQEVNEGLQVFNKATGASEFGPVAVASIWTGFGGVCETNGEGDIIVLYDHFANRWLVSEFAVQPAVGVPTDECVAISTSPDATGSYYRYDFNLQTFGAAYYDYPHIGIWSDGYYMSNNVFNTAGTSFLGPRGFAMDRSKMLQGLPATIIAGTAAPVSGAGDFLPADIDGMTLPPSGAPETFIGFPSGGNYTIYHFHADFGTPANSTWTTFGTAPAAAFTQLCTGGRSCVPQPGVSIGSATTGNGLDGIGDRFMFRAAYRNFGTQASPNESLVSNFSVCASGTCTAGTGVGQSGVRWFQLGNVTNGPVTVVQESTYNNGGVDVLWRWMGSIAQDNAGDMMLGFSTSAGTTGTSFASIHYAGRLSTDPVNSMAQGEATMFAGSGSQSSSGNRWGDYSAMTVDPEDDCTFWYTTEYYSTNASFSWKTRIANFSFPQCTPQTTQSVGAVSVYNLADFTSINPGTTAGFTVTVNSSGTAPANGLSFSDPLPSGQGINWSISSGGAEWSITGSPPNQALAFSTTSMPNGTSSAVHVQSSTTSAICGSSSLAHTAMLTSSNAGSGNASASTAIDCANCTPNAFTDNNPQNAAPTQIYDQATATVNNTVYMIGGFQGPVASVYGTGAWKLTGNTWTAVSSLTAANEREAPGAASDGSQYIYMMDGLNSANTAQTTTIRYDTVGDSYATEAAPLHGGYHGGAAYFNGNVYYMGGFTSSAQTAVATNLDIYNVGTNTWSAGAAMPVGLAYAQVAYMNVSGTDYIYVAGGLIVGGTAQATLYRYNIGTNSWSTVGAMPTSIWGSPNGVVNGYWVFGGGEVNNGVSNTVYSYLPSTNTWTLNASSMQQPRYRGGGTATSTSLYVVGGRDPALSPQSDTQVYTPSLCAPGLISVVSRQTHGAAGTFDLALSTTSTVVEPRSTGGNYQIIFNYSVPVNSGTASASGGTGTAGSPSFSGNSVTVPVSGVTDQQRLTITANGVSGPGTGSTTMGTQIGFLIGDVNGDGVVNVGDTAQARGAAGATLDTTNFLNDVNLDGMVNVGDTIIVRGNSGNALP